MSVELITGYAGTAHISSADDGARNIGTFGDGKYVLDTGDQLACAIGGANSATIGAGDALFEGRHVRVVGTETVTIDNGAQDVNRNDIICFKYTRDISTMVETVTLHVIKGTATSGTPVDPTIPAGSIAEGADTAYMALWRIPITGITPGTPVKMYGDVLPSTHELATRVTPVDQIPNIPASKITSGTLSIARGGTGAATWSPNFVLAGPASGTSSAAPTRRKLVAADLPASITSSTTGNAATASKATKLSTARSLYVALGSNYDPSNPVTFDGTANKALPVSGTLPAARGGTGQTSLQATRNAMGLGNTTGALPVANGGTGLTASPSMLTNLSSTSAANIMTASPRPGITGCLPIANGGTGATSAASARTHLGITPANIGAASAPTELYNNAAGTMGTISAAFSSYKYLRIFYCVNGAHNTSTRDEGCVVAYRAAGSIEDTIGHRIDNTHMQISTVSIHWTDSGMTADMRSYANFGNGAAVEVGQDSKVYIWRVEGWN